MSPSDLYFHSFGSIILGTKVMPEGGKSLPRQIDHPTFLAATEIWKKCTFHIFVVLFFRTGFPWVRFHVCLVWSINAKCIVSCLSEISWDKVFPPSHTEKYTEKQFALSMLSPHFAFWCCHWLEYTENLCDHTLLDEEDRCLPDDYLICYDSPCQDCLRQPP